MREMRTISLWKFHLNTIPITIDITLLISIVAIISITYNLFPNAHWLSFISTALLYIFLIAHEIAHVLVGEKIGIEVKEIRLSLTGATAYFKKEADTGQACLAASGPLLSIILMIIFAIFTMIFMAIYKTSEIENNSLISILAFSTAINAMIAIMNLLPIYPLDGGRLLQIAIQKITKNKLKSLAITCGITISICVITIFWTEWDFFKHHESNGIIRIVVAIMLGGQALGAYRAEARKGGNS